MKKYLYDEKEVNLIKHLIETTPHKVYWDFLSYVFDYGVYYIQLECVSKEAATQNEFDEAMTTNIVKYDEPFQTQEHTELVRKNTGIEAAYIVRTFLYFSTFKDYSRIKIWLNKIFYSIRAVLFGEDPWYKLLSDSIGGSQEFIVHPESPQTRKVNDDYSNLIDVGLVLKINNQFLTAYLTNNGFGFHVWDDKYFFNEKELMNNVDSYQFIRIE